MLSPIERQKYRGDNCEELRVCGGAYCNSLGSTHFFFIQNIGPISINFKEQLT